MKKPSRKSVQLIFWSILLASTSSTHAMDLSWNGFGSTYYGQLSNNQLLTTGFSDTHPNFTSFSLMGLNLGASVEERLNFAAQFVALGRAVGSADKFGLIAQWAYINYSPTPGTSLRMGRQLFPHLLASEYVRVGYLLPFREIPTNVFYILPFTRFDGASAYQTIETDIGKLTIGLFGGTPIADINTVATSASGYTFTFANLLGTQVTLDGDGWRIRAQASRFFSRLVTSSPVPASDLRGTEQNYSLGYRFDKFNFVSWGEYVYARTPDGTTLATGGKYGERAYGYYWLGGYRLGKWMPRYTYSKAFTDYNISSNGTTTTHTLGCNYQAGEQSVIKVEYERTSVPNPGGGGYFVTQPTGATVTSSGAFYAGVDFIF